MRAKLKKAVRARFSEGVPARCPDFDIFLNNSGLMTWCRSISEKLYVFVELDFNEKADKFAVQVKWNQVREWRSSGYHQPERLFGDETLQRIRGCKNGEDLWDLDPEYSLANEREHELFMKTGKLIISRLEPTPIETVMPLVGPAVDDALSLLAEYGMPFLKRVAAAHNVPWPDDLAALYPM
jgi:hypothetical protein